MNEDICSGPVIVFDSGLGGLSVLKHIRQQMPDRQLIYVADNAHFPYGDWQEEKLAAHITSLIGRLLEQYQPVAVVIACNTASTLVLPNLRAQFSVPFIGTVPAIKPAAEQTMSGIVSVLATPGTIARDYTHQLIRDFAAQSRIELIATPRLASIAEALLNNEEICLEEVRREIAPAFLEIGTQRTDTVVLACTHYPFLIETMASLAPWPVTWIDPAPAIARRLVSVLDGKPPIILGDSFAIFTNGKPPSRSLASLMGSLGLLAN